jgi:nucleoside-diphosphate-sugar epimerase
LLALDLEPDATEQILACDLRSEQQVADAFQCRSIRTVIHLAAVLPSAFRADPVRGAEVNLTGACHVLRQAVHSGVKRFVFASSLSVYGSAVRERPLSEDDPPAPDDPYGACKRAVESVGEALAGNRALQFVALRIGRVIGPGAKNTSSPWRSQMFDTGRPGANLVLPFAEDDLLSLVHVEDVVRMLLILADSQQVQMAIYNGLAEVWRVEQLRDLIQSATGARVELAPRGVPPGPICDAGRFAREFGFRLVGVAERLAAARQS